MTAPDSSSDITAQDAENTQNLLAHPALANFIKKILEKSPSDTLTSSLKNPRLSTKDIERLFLVHNLHQGYINALQPHPALQQQVAELAMLLLSLAFTFKREPLDQDQQLFDYYHVLITAMAKWYPTEGRRNQRLPELIAENIRHIKSVIDNNSHNMHKTLEDLQAALSREVTRETTRTAQIEKRLIDIENGQRAVKEAEAAITTLYGDHLSNQPLPEELAEFILNELRDEMQYLLINSGRGNPGYRLLEKLIKMLSWVFNQAKTAEQRRQLSSVLPDIMASLSDDYHSQTCEPELFIQFLGQLNQTFFKVLQNQPVACIKTDLSTAQNPATEKPLSVSKQIRQTWQHISAGDWFSFSQENGDELRIKLTHCFDDNRTLVFCNYLGLKVLEKPKNDFILCLASGVAKPINLNQAKHFFYEKAEKTAQKILLKLQTESSEERLRRTEQLRLAAEKARTEAARLQREAQEKRAQNDREAEQQHASISAERRQQSQEEVKQLKNGDWISYNSPTQKSLRAKLAVHLLSSDKYIFTDRAGNKLLEFSSQDLVDNIALGVITVHGGGSSFEDELAKVVRTLRKT